MKKTLPEQFLKHDPDAPERHVAATPAAAKLPDDGLPYLGPALVLDIESHFKQE